MSRPQWMICERSLDWVAALRSAIGRSGWPAQSVPRLIEVRQLGDIEGRLVIRPDLLALIEVHRTILPDLLVWLSEMRQLHRHSRFVALVDRVAWSLPTRAVASQRRTCQQLIQALMEAGAHDVVISPRQTRTILDLGWRHQADGGSRHAEDLSHQAVAERVWESLPWQAD